MQFQRRIESWGFLFCGLRFQWSREKAIIAHGCTGKMSEGTGQRSGARRVCSEPIPCDKADLSADGVLQLGPVSSPSPPSIASALLSILQQPSPTASPKNSRHKAKRALVQRYTEVGSGAGSGEGQSKWTEWMHNQLQFAFLCPFCFCFRFFLGWGESFVLFFEGLFYIKMTSTMFFLRLFFFSFKEKEFSAI